MLMGPVTQFLCWCHIWVTDDGDQNRRRLKDDEWQRVVARCSVYHRELSCLFANRCLLHEGGEDLCVYQNQDTSFVGEELPVVNSARPNQHDHCHLWPAWSRVS